MSLRSLTAVVCLALVVVQASRAEEIGFTFSGVVIDSTLPPWSVPVPLWSPVTGALIYDLDSPPTHQPGDCDCLGYRQQRLNGFFAKFGDVSVRADDYVVEVANDLPQPNPQETADVVSVKFASDYDPPLQLPLVVDGVPQSVGLFNVNFVGPPDLFETPDLPMDLDQNDFPTRLGFLSDTPDGAVDVAFSVNALERIDLLPGDYDLDNDVDSADYDKWWSTFGSTAELVADGNLNGVVDAADYTIWRSNLGTVPVSSGHAIAPEPRSIILAAAAIVWIICRRFRQVQQV